MIAFVFSQLSSELFSYNVKCNSNSVSTISTNKLNIHINTRVFFFCFFLFLFAFNITTWVDIVWDWGKKTYIQQHDTQRTKHIYEYRNYTMIWFLSLSAGESSRFTSFSDLTWEGIYKNTIKHKERERKRRKKRTYFSSNSWPSCKRRQRTD